MNVLAQEQLRTLHKIKIVVYLTNGVYGAMTRFSSRNTSLLLFMSDWRGLSPKIIEVPTETWYSETFATFPNVRLIEGVRSINRGL